MSGANLDWEAIPGRFQGFLLAMARSHLAPRLRAKVGPESMVQEALLEAYRDREKFRGQSEPELAAYLRAVLLRNIRDAIRAMGRGKRDAALEVSLAALDRASGQAEPPLAPTPEAALEKLEEMLRFVGALAALPEAERDVLELRHLQGLSHKEIAARLERSHDSVRRLASQGERRLRALFERTPPP